MPHESKRSALSVVTVYGAGPVAILAVVVLQKRSLLSDIPLWILIVTIMSAGFSNLAAERLVDFADHSSIAVHTRVAVSVFTTAAVIYLTGWGSMMVIAFAIGSGDLLRTLGPSATRPNLVWNWVAILLFEAGVQVGLLPSVIPVELGHAVALAGGILLTVLTDLLGRTATAKEYAESKLFLRGKYFQDMVEHAADAIGVIHPEGSIVSMSPAIFPILGYQPDEVENRSLSDFIDSDDVAVLTALMTKVLRERGGHTVIEVRLKHKDGTNRRIVASLTNPDDSWGDFIIINLHDVTTERDLEEMLRHDARHDPLTGLLNRAAFGDAATRTFQHASHAASVMALLYIDLDGFKQINDTLGHEVGDRVLTETAARLMSSIRHNDIVARLGGDEFAILLASVDSHEVASHTAERILEAVSAPMDGVPADLRVGASIGITVCDPGSAEIAALTREADEAMYRAKRNGRARWEFSKQAS